MSGGLGTSGTAANSVVNQQQWDSWGVERSYCYEEETANSLMVML
jgi:hypothetical protein